MLIHWLQHAGDVPVHSYKANSLTQNEVLYVEALACRGERALQMLTVFLSFMYSHRDTIVCQVRVSVLRKWTLLSLPLTNPPELTDWPVWTQPLVQTEGQSGLCACTCVSKSTCVCVSEWFSCESVLCSEAFTWKHYRRSSQIQPPNIKHFLIFFLLFSCQTSHTAGYFIVGIWLLLYCWTRTCIYIRLFQ